MAGALRYYEDAGDWHLQVSPSHPYGVAALIKQGSCNAKLDRLAAAAEAYRAALQIIQTTHGAEHPKAVEIRAWLDAQ